MAKARAVLKRIHAVRNIAKITKTMQMIATARFKRAFNRAVASRPYTDRLTRLIGELTEAARDFRHPLLEAREPKKAAIVVVASNRGLCGGYNSGVARALLTLRQELDAKGVETETHLVGKKLAGMLRFQGVVISRLVTHIEDRATFEEVDALASPFVERFEAGEIDELYVVYTQFLSTATQRAVAERVLPLARERRGGPAGRPDREYIFSPDPESILSELLPRSVRLHVFQAFLDAAVSEQTARMVAMKAATDNAIEMIDDLRRVYNRRRQAQITTELTEIMGGAAALE